MYFLSPLPKGDAELGPSPNARPFPDEYKRNHTHARAQTTKQGARAGDAEAGEHVCRREGQNHGEQGAAARGGGVRGGGVEVVRVGKVVEHGHEDEHKAKAKGDATEHGSNK